MDTCQMIKVVLTFAGLVIAGGFVGFVIARWAYHRLGEFWQDMYEREYGVCTTCFLPMQVKNHYYFWRRHK